ncbi:leucine-rich repeat domain-containing protein [Actinomadura logoneensis]|uniref:Leucine-rich repeat domain-containing protein n=1 Tax=Actinomadura logoneensis TaxID=2293572 RepID=A0A372JRN7_9ACTN|nr:STM4015 family protein [Actinomadura logoneensis]RFU42609.1 leucine-rich repeat domain-containing protein [Actinomadura logoneensis]
MIEQQNLTEFAGLPVRREAEPGVAPESVAWKIDSNGRDKWRDVLQRLFDAVPAERITALVVGWWAYDDEDEPDPVQALVEAADRMPALRALFLGDMSREQAEISWIRLSDVTPLLAAYPALEQFEVRGGDGLLLQPVASTTLRRLRFESGGLPAEVVRAVWESDLPNLAHLDFWIGDPNYNYGGEVRMDDLEPFLSGERFPALRRLALENCEFQDQIAEAVATAPVVAQLQSLSLAKGTLTDRGAEALLTGQPLTHLNSLDLHHHYLSDDMMRRLRHALPGVDLNLTEQQTPDDGWLYIAISE